MAKKELILLSINSESNVRTYIFAAIFTLLLIYFAVLKAYTNTYNLPRAVREQKARRKLEDLCNLLYERREESLYHYNWAKQRNDNASMEGMEGKITDLDKEIDAVEARCEKLYQAHGVSFRHR